MDDIGCYHSCHLVVTDCSLSLFFTWLTSKWWSPDFWTINLYVIFGYLPCLASCHGVFQREKYPSGCFQNITTYCPIQQPLYITHRSIGGICWYISRVLSRSGTQLFPLTFGEVKMEVHKDPQPIASASSSFFTLQVEDKLRLVVGDGSWNTTQFLKENISYAMKQGIKQPGFNGK